jgi:type IV secretory pathway protease TraF
MSEKELFKRLVLSSAITVALVAALIFGILVCAGDDWLPGIIIVLASSVGLGWRIGALRKPVSGPRPGPPHASPPS